MFHTITTIYVLQKYEINSKYVILNDINFTIYSRWEININRKFSVLEWISDSKVKNKVGVFVRAANT